MTESQKIWKRACEDLVDEIVYLGYPEKLGYDIARLLGSPKAIERMRGYLIGYKPTDAELIVDEALSIKNEIDEWKKKKSSQLAGMRYNEVLEFGLNADDFPE